MFNFLKEAFNFNQVKRNSDISNNIEFFIKKLKEIYTDEADYKIEKNENETTIIVGKGDQIFRYFIIKDNVVTVNLSTFNIRGTLFLTNEIIKLIKNTNYKFYFSMDSDDVEYELAIQTMVNPKSFFRHFSNNNCAALFDSVITEDVLNRITFNNKCITEINTTNTIFDSIDTANKFFAFIKDSNLKYNHNIDMRTDHYLFLDTLPYSVIQQYEESKIIFVYIWNDINKYYQMQIVKK